MYRILELNPQLKAFESDINLRMELYRNTKKRLLGSGGTLKDFANAHHYFGIHHFDGCWVYREWAPSAYQLYLTGEFNNWDQTSHPLQAIGGGVKEIVNEKMDAWMGTLGRNREPPSSLSSLRRPLTTSLSR